MEYLNQELAKEYLRILKEFESENTEFLKNTENYFSQVHLGFVPDGFRKENFNVFILGRETRGWYGLEGDYNEKYIENSMEKSKSWSEKMYAEKILNKKTGKGCSFFRFFSNVAKNIGREKVLWGNLYAFSYKKSHPKESEYFREIEEVSKKLLVAQIKVLQPKLIIIACGVDKVTRKTRDECLNVQFSGLAVDGADLHKRYLESCKIFIDGCDEIKGYRIQHPSSINYESRKAREYLLTALKNFA
ncbi:hypothetical protein [Neisseria sp. S1]|uniref:hypothetical protein n=1 Tax=Neisseria sp. S1 TaxID=3318354 RepID=UPI003A840933